MKNKFNIEERCIWKKIANTEHTYDKNLPDKIKKCYYNCNGYDVTCEYYLLKHGKQL